MIREAAQHLRGETSIETIYFVLFDEAAEGSSSACGTRFWRSPPRTPRERKARDAARGIAGRPYPAIWTAHIRRLHARSASTSKSRVLQQSGSQAFADYYTSVDVHPIFGRLLARQFAEMWENLGRPEKCMLVEAGAGVGRLASHILDFSASNFPIFTGR